ncbi:pyrimidine dimer DNA glycosylase/endonuclease V [Diaphorobacter caeni]|uniref:pyrimidine dimer DNA glycosylase/endonuclease V n=1 Tax=Diaphorobacter caeni TaxID=2784387 RepID=UPI00188F8D0E|nr:pyrimidine dimer DNA glycosylase/endonuclease V [Diaphorobacter caeni]MBF5005128.1 DNA lyase [Diaphorobacter caeni]
MRLWSLHPRYLDAKGLVALWREALLAQAVLRGETKGYRNHPQLDRFKEQPDPAAALARYLQVVHAEATRRGYRFDGSKIHAADANAVITVTSGQLEYEWEHLRKKLQTRSPADFEKLALLTEPELHPMFNLQPGPIADWERP